MRDSSVTLAPGSILDGKYEIVGVLGVGGMGEVYKARHLHLNALRCIKTMKRELALDEGFRARFVREARLATKVHHANVALVHDFAITVEGASYLVTEFIDGITLRQWSAQHGRFPVALAIDIILQVLAGLHEIHKQGLVHRDISAENIMIFYDEERWIAKIIDLGIAKALEAPMSERTQVGLFVGNPRYSSPEQLGELPEGEELDCRADIYSLGVVLFEMVIGSPPFPSKTPHGYILGHLSKTPPPFESVLPGSDWPAGFEAAVLKALAKKREQRYSNAREFVRALRPFVMVSSRTIEREMAEVIGSTTPPPLTTPELTMRHGADDPTQETPLPPRPTVEREVEPTIALKKTYVEQTAIPGESEEEAWTLAESEDSAEAWQRFIDRFPSSHRIVTARLNRDEIRAFDVAAVVDSAEEWRRFLESFPAAKRRDVAAERYDDAVEREMMKRFDETTARDTEQAYDAFLDEYGDLSISDEIRNLRAQLIERVDALEREDLPALEAFLERWPDSRKREEVEQAITRLRERSVAAEAFKKISEEPTPETLRRFIAQHHDSVYVVPANNLLRRLEEEAYDRFVESRDARGLERFLDSFPEGRYADDARAMAQHWKQEAKAKSAWDRVARADSVKTFRQFAEEHAGTTYAERAVRRAEELEALAELKTAELAGDATRIRFVAMKAESPLVVSEAEQALQRLNSREATRAEESDWESAWRDGTVTAFRNFLLRHPSSAHHAEARAALREAEIFELAVKENKLALFKAFLHDFPEGRHFAEAKIRAATLRDGDSRESGTDPGITSRR